jgi:outer membrane protein OmpA-like peptidoglycan-associated protein/tetratricopeptide (TPR) repeat protein
MKKFLLYALLSFGMFPIMAQTALVRKGDFYYKQMAYPKAISYYSKAVKKDSTLQNAVFKLADCYRLTNNRQMAEVWYGKAVQMPSVTSIYKFYYGQALMNNGKYAQAKKWMQDFVLDDKNDGRGQSFVKAIDAYESYFIDSSNFAVTKLDINSENADFGASIYQEGIVFASSRKRTEMIERNHSWTNEPFLALYYSRGKENKFRTPELFAEKLKTKYNDGPVCFSKSGEEMYITRNNIESGKVHKSSDKVVKLKIFKSKSTGGGEWGALESFAYNNDNYSCAHPSLSADGQFLYFSSDMPGGKGGMDLYVCNKQGNGWSKPVNLGDTINTRGNEVFPENTDDGTLYFASDGHPGIGGLDIFYTRDLGGKYVNPVNVGYPLNTSDDDFGMIYDAKNKIGYLSSNRANRGFDDDLYTFKKKSIRIRGIVVNKEDGQPIKNARVELVAKSNPLTFTTMENGRFEFPAEFDQDYSISGKAEGLGDTTVLFATSSATPVDPFVRLELGKSSEFALSISVIDADTKQPLPGALIKDELTNQELGSTGLDGQYKQALVPEKDEQLMVALAGYRPKIIMLKGQEGESPRNLNYVVELTAAKDVYPYENWYKIVYYDLDKYNIREDAQKTMTEVIAFLKEHPDVKISINSHTDSRATKEYNEKLSENRSKSLKKHILANGISSKQIGNVSWSGESVMVNNCGDGEPCTEEMHQLNRRTEITVNGIIH